MKKFFNFKSLFLAVVVMAVTLTIIAVCGFIPKAIPIVRSLKSHYYTSVGNPAKGYKEKEADILRKKILNTNNTEEIYEITGTKYYVSTSGDDNNDGLSPEAPIKTLDRLNEIYLEEGSAVLFKRGDTFRFDQGVQIISHVTYGCYGEGEKPKIYGSLKNYAENTEWEQTQKNIWRIPFPYAAAGGCVINHGEIVGVQKHKGLDTLKNNGDYMHDTNDAFFYLYCDNGNPTVVYEDIEIMLPFALLSTGGSRENVVIDNLCLKYASGFAISAVNGTKDFTVTNCEIGFIGGKWTDAAAKKLRYGNAIEFWNGGTDIKVENNWFYQTYDSALSWQGDSGYDYRNISFIGNLFEYNNADIEFFERGNSVLENFVIRDNLMRFTSMGWGTRINDGGIRGIEGCIRGVTWTGMSYAGMDLRSVYFENNIIDCPARQIINWNINPEQRENIHTSGTQIYVKSKYRTLDSCLQGLQTQKGQFYNQRFATNKKELVEMFTLFEENAQIYWNGK